MLDQTQRQAILTLHERGVGKRAIARALGISRNTVRDVLADGNAAPPPLDRAEQLEPVRDHILALHASCKGNFVRVHEELAARHGVTVMQVLLAWLLARSPVMLPIPGTGSVAHLEENTAAATIALEPSEVAAITASAT